jgi:EAL domain-containing protein (putative c-di-GMP-specific phosphodiesterase class I)
MDDRLAAHVRTITHHSAHLFGRRELEANLAHRLLLALAMTEDRCLEGVTVLVLEDDESPLREHAHRIVLEITESGAIRDYRRLRETLAGLRAQGFRVALDDLGAGYSGLTALAELEPDFVKLDMGLNATG